MEKNLESGWKKTLHELEKEIHLLQEEIDKTDQIYSGLKEITPILKLAGSRFSLCRHYLNALTIRPPVIPVREIYEKAKKAANLGLNSLESLLRTELSNEDRAVIIKDPEYTRAKDKLRNIILAGGGVFFEAKAVSAKKLKLISRTLAASIIKFSVRDDNYPPPETENYPRFIKKLINLFFPVLLRSDQQPPPYGIEEGEEKLYRSEKIKMPLNQAILYYEEELLPELKRKLLEDPGNMFIQQQIYSVGRKVEEYKHLKFIPRSTPIVIEKGFYTDWISGYTENGELLVNVPVPAEFGSKTNTDRIMELVRMDFVKSIAGKGISKELDKQYKYLKSLKSGIRGSSRTPSLKVDTQTGYRLLKYDIPFLSCLENKDAFVELSQTIAGRTLKEAGRTILKEIIHSTPENPSRIMLDY
ncbi:MAG: hypothetical protein GXP33_10720 [Spirochaetes bacterium]|nr:hypothetical protein [Spirochaetota bacterium]